MAWWIAWRSKPPPRMVVLLLPLLLLPLLLLLALLPAATAPLVVVGAAELLLLLLMCHVGRKCRKPAPAGAGQCQAERDERAPPPAATAAGAPPPQLPRCSMLHCDMLPLTAPSAPPERCCGETSLAHHVQHGQYWWVRRHK